MQDFPRTLAKLRSIALAAAVAGVAVVAGSLHQAVAADPPTAAGPLAEQATDAAKAIKPDAKAGPDAAAAQPQFAQADLDFFEKQVRPILAESCFKCHNDKKQKGGLRLDARAFVAKGGEHGPAVDPAAKETGTLMHAVGYADEDMQMPPDGKLPQAKIDVLAKWAMLNAPWPAGEAPAAAAAAPGHAADPSATDPEKNRDYWAYKPPVRPAIPTLKDPALAAWSKQPIDALIAAKLEAKGLKPSERADKVALVRRAYYDLTGLPPSPADVDGFVNDASPDAWAKLVDKLLASSHYGEKWGRHWLDLVRYAETHGYERDSAKPQAWRYRDYVIRSFNADKPYDQFLKEQFAGDELDTVTPDSMIATGFYRLGVWDDEPADRPLARYDVLDGVVSTTSSVVLGMSVGCARCHDHKKDPILAKDYYSMLAFFQDVGDMNAKNLRVVDDPSARQTYEKAAAERRAREADLYKQVYAIEQRFLGEAKAKGVDTGKLAGADLAGLTYKFYRDTWESLPDFTNLKFEESGPVAENFVSLAPATRNEAIGLVFDGSLKVPADGQYTFHLKAAEGVRLTVDGKRVIDRPAKGRTSADFTTTLKAGLLPFKLEYFNAYATPQLSLAWSGAGFDRRMLSREPGETSADGKVLAADSREAPQQWMFHLGTQPDGWQKPRFKPEQWQQAPGGFGTKGTPGGVVRTEWKTPEIYLRRDFTLDTLPASATLSILHDEDVEVYLNGVPAYQATGSTIRYERVPVADAAVKALRKGRNVIAVHCKQTIGGQYVDVGLIETTAGVELAKLISEHGETVLGAKTAVQYARLTAALDASRKALLPPAGMEVMAVAEPGRGMPTHILIRGNPGSEGTEVKPGFPTVLVPKGQTEPTLPKASPDGKSSGKRRVLAEWLASDKNPLTARVMANRVWQFHFGRGLNPSPNEYGHLGEPCTHPELLDYLATELVAGGWKLKPLHRQIMLSNAYQMSAKANAEGMAADPANNLFWRFNMRRLAAEEVRDSMLAAAGNLNLDLFGPSVYPPIPKAVLAGQSVPGQGWGKSTEAEATRRSVYVHVKRSLLVPILNIHDQADTDSSCPVRFTTTVPTQALGMLNGEFTNEQAAKLADRLTKEAPGGLEKQVTAAIRLTTGREPTAEEVKADVTFVGKLKAKDAAMTDADALRLYCLMALNTNEFVYLD